MIYCSKCEYEFNTTIGNILDYCPGCGKKTQCTEDDKIDLSDITSELYKGV